MTAITTTIVTAPAGFHYVVPAPNHGGFGPDFGWTVAGSLAHTMGEGFIGFDRDDMQSVADYLNTEWDERVAAGE